eukprot:PhF_6_TR31720/c0_g1_i1/m.46680
MSSLHDNDARAVLDQFATTIDTARDKLSKEENRLSAVSHEVTTLRTSVRGLTDTRQRLNSTLHTLEAECVRAEQLSSRRKDQIDSIHAALTTLVKSKQESEDALSRALPQLLEHRQSFIRKSIEAQGAMITMIESYVPDKLKLQVEARKHELSVLQAQLQATQMWSNKTTNNKNVTISADEAVAAANPQAQNDVSFEEVSTRLDETKSEVARSVTRRLATLAERTSERDALKFKMKNLRETSTLIEAELEAIKGEVAAAQSQLNELNCEGCGVVLEGVMTE